MNTESKIADKIYLCKDANGMTYRGIKACRYPGTGDTILCILPIIDGKRIDLDVQHMDGLKVIVLEDRERVARTLGEVADMTCGLDWPDVGGYLYFIDDDNTINDSLELIFPDRRGRQIDINGNCL